LPSLFVTILVWINRHGGKPKLVPSGFWHKYNQVLSGNCC